MLCSSVARAGEYEDGVKAYDGIKAYDEIKVYDEGNSYTGDSYVRTFNKGANWTVLEVGITGKFKLCVLRSSLDYIDKEYPQYGALYLQISYPSNNITFLGENIGLYFKITKQGKLQVDDGASFTITPESPMHDLNIIDSMMKGRSAVIELDFGAGDPSIHTFSLYGFTKAYNLLSDCSGIPIAEYSDPSRKNIVKSDAYKGKLI